ncbi:protein TRIGALACTOSYLDIACYLGLYCEROL 4, chloroplastic [Mercurialis annua]|uniref:protein TRIGALACTOSYLDIACYLGLYCEROL 4, chloroplastic n=1 Tax=Mercurialis annua TaxID=3986 RepID=UPI00215FEBAE|nr:protein TRIGALACTOSYLDIACYLGLYCEROL 4, chloroplastic [Mercurialis annua]
MKKLRWAADEGGIWEQDISTPITLEGEARPVPGEPLPLGICRGTKLSRPKQLHFFQRFMSSPFIPSHSHPHGFSLQSVLALPSPSPNWFCTVLGQFNFQKFVSSLPTSQPDASSLFHTITSQLRDKSLYALGFCSELSLTPNDTFLFTSDAYAHPSKSPRNKAILHHKFPDHNLTLQAVSPGLFVDGSGRYWDVPVSTSIDLASLPSEAGLSYHLCMHHNAGNPQLFGGGHTLAVPAALRPGFSFKSSFSFKHNVEIWRSKAPKLKMVQPFDIFLSNPHISASAIVGATMAAYIGDNSVGYQQVDQSRSFTGLSLHAPALKSSLLADMFSSVSLTAQHGNFQRLFLDLTRFQARLDVPYGRKFITNAAKLAQDFFNSQQPSMESVKAICPNATISLQQQIAGPFSFRVDSGVAIEWKNKDWEMQVRDPVFALEYALQVLGSAKAIAWYSPKQKEFMVELRFFET